jgi:hypothetical protein
MHRDWQHGSSASAALPFGRTAGRQHCSMAGRQHCITASRQASRQHGNIAARQRASTAASVQHATLSELCSMDLQTQIQVLLL